MGAELSLMAPTAASIAISAYVDVLDQVQYRKQIGSSRFLKMIKANDPNGAVVVKLFIKPNEGINLSEWNKLLLEQNSKLADVHSVLTYSKIIETERAGYLIRQYIKTNVYDRISTRPFLEEIEKKWIAFQLLNTLSECHDRGVTHGDIKTENILVTSWNWILLSDFAPFKPIYLPEDNPGTFSFYFDTSQRRICYLAPERFLRNDENEDGKPTTVTPAMDIFSLGCAIAEIFLEGSPIFTLSQLYKYKRGEYIPDLTGITNMKVRELVQSMISLDPNERMPAKEYLKNYRESVFPDSFYNFFYEYFKSFNENFSYNAKGSGQECDLRINRLFNDFDKISYFLGYRYPVEKDPIETSATESLPLKLSLPGVPKTYKLRSTSKVGGTDDIALIILTLIFASMRNVREENSKFQALELVLALSERIHDEGKLDRCLPYIMTLLNDTSYNIQATALITLTQLLSLVDSIGPVNALLFPEYIRPRLSALISKASPYVRMSFAACLPYLAQTSLRFYEMTTIMKSSVLEASIDPETENTGLASTTGVFDISRESLTEDFEKFATSMLTDSESIVKISLLKNLLPLCSFFGREISNDLILSHLITYLNDKDPLLRIAFVEAVTGLSIYVGTTSLEHYILPLLVQTLSDPEELVVIKVLNTFHDILRLGLIKKEFVWDLLATVSKLLLHPNEWIKQGALLLVVTIAESQSLADLYCMLYPIIRPYLDYDATDFGWSTLYSICKRPLSRSIYNLACTWSVRAETTLFWKQVNKSSTDVFGNRGLDFVSSSSNKNEKTYSMKFGNLEIPLSQEDKGWVDRLISSGLSEQELWKIADLREYIYRVSRLTFRSNNKEYELGNLQLQQLGILPRNVFFDSKFHSDNFAQSSLDEHTYLDSIDDRLAEDFFTDQYSTEISLNNTVTPSFSDDFAKSLILNKPKAAPSIMTNEENAFGELESSFQKSRKPSSHAKKLKPSTEMTLVITNSYKGKDNFIIRFLNSVSLEPGLDEFQEFNNKTQATDFRISKGWSPKDDLVSHLKEHKAGINSIDVSQDHSFFVTGDDIGSLKVWDSNRLERNVSHSSVLSIELGSSITHVKFLGGYNCFGVSTKDGHVRVLSVNYDSSRKTFKVIDGLTIIRETKLVDKYLVNFAFGHREQKSILFGVSSSSEIIGIDIRTMSVDFSLQNNPAHGVITSFTIDSNDSWLLIGTSKGVLDFWDLRFKVPLKTWRFKRGFAIKKMSSCSNEYNLNRKKGRFVTIIGGTGDSDAFIFDVSSGSIREIFTRSSSNSGFDDYSVIEVPEDISVDDIVNESEAEIDDKSLTALQLIETQVEGKKKFWILTASPTYELVLWNVYEPGESKVILTSAIESADKVAPSYSGSQINPTLKIVTEKFKVEAEDVEKSGKKRKKARGLMSEEQDQLIKGHHDIITDFALLLRPYEMIVSVDRSGVLNVYK